MTTTENVPRTTGPVRVLWCSTHRMPIGLTGNCPDHRKAEPDDDGWWSIDRRRCTPVRLEEV